MTDQRRVIARVLSDSTDHPDVETVYQRASELDPKIGLATVYRTLRLFEEASILERHDFGDGRARYEEIPEEHHDHLIDVQSGKVIEFRNEAIEELQRKVVEELGYKLVDHRLELYGVRSTTRTAELTRARGARPVSDARKVDSNDPSSRVTLPATSVSERDSKTSERLRSGLVSRPPMCGGPGHGLG